MNSKPTFEMSRRVNGGTVTIELAVRNATAELRSLLDTLGYRPDCTIANRRSILCATPEAVEAARRPLASLFGRHGEWIG